MRFQNIGGQHPHESIITFIVTENNEQKITSLVDQEDNADDTLENEMQALVLC